MCSPLSQRLHSRLWPLFLALAASLTCSAAGTAPSERPASSPVDKSAARHDRAAPAWRYVVSKPGQEGVLRYGYIDSGGRVVIPCEYQGATGFSEGLAFINAAGRRSCIDTDGHIVFNLPEDCVSPWFFSDGLCYANRGGRVDYDRVTGGSWGYLDRHGRWAIEPRWVSKGDPPVSSFSEGMAAVVQEGRWGFIDRRGEWVIRPRFAAAGSFAEGLAAVRAEGKAENPTQQAVKETGKWGFIARDGRWAVEPTFDKVSDFSEGLAAVRRGDRSGFVDQSGAWAIELGDRAWGEHSEFAGGLAAVLLPVQGAAGPDVHCPGCDQPARGVRFGDKCPNCGAKILGPIRWGYVNRRGETAIAPKFDDAHAFSEGLAAVKVQEEEGGRWGFIDRRGQFAIEPRFLAVEPSGFRGGLVRVTLVMGANRAVRECYINTTGRAVWSSP